MKKKLSKEEIEKIKKIKKSKQKAMNENKAIEK